VLPHCPALLSFSMLLIVTVILGIQMVIMMIISLLWLQEHRLQSTTC